MDVCADLHIHTYESDGTLSPTAVVHLAQKVGIQTIAITDHDSVNGITEALLVAKQVGIEVIPGIEFSCLYQMQEVHILGYYIDVSNRELRQEISYIAEARRDRAEKIVRKLNKLGIEISYDRVRKIAAGDIIGRPHIAQAMIEKNYIKNMQQAFSKSYIDKGGRAYVERYKLSPGEAINLIHNAGGIAVIAHPGLCYRSNGLQEEDIVRIKQNRLDGLEVFHSAHSVAQTDYYLNLAMNHSLLITGGSDFHGGTTKEGSEIGSICLPYKYVKKIKERVMSDRLK